MQTVGNSKHLTGNVRTLYNMFEQGNKLLNAGVYLQVVVLQLVEHKRKKKNKAFKPVANDL